MPSALLSGIIAVTAGKIVYDPFTVATVKFAKFSPPMIGAIVEVPILGPTTNGVLTQLRLPTYTPVTWHMLGDFTSPLKTPEPLPAVAVTAALKTLAVAVALVDESINLAASAPVSDNPVMFTVLPLAAFGSTKFAVPPVTDTTCVPNGTIALVKVLVAIVADVFPL